MAEKSISQETVAASLGISQESVSRRVRGVIEWRLSELPTLAAVLNVSVHDLMKDGPSAGAA